MWLLGCYVENGNLNFKWQRSYSRQVQLLPLYIKYDTVFRLFDDIPNFFFYLMNTNIHYSV